MPKGKGPQDPLGNYTEWAAHRYDPGHYLGGTIEPHLRKSDLGPRARRLSGIMLTVSGMLGLLLTVSLVSGGLEGLVGGLVYSGLCLAAGVVMWRSSRPAKKPNADRPRH